MSDRGESYGAAFADVYDDWYANVTDVEATVDTLARLSSGGNVLELGVGTGRIATPLAERLSGKARLVGVDSSVEMLDVWRTKLAANDAARSRSVVAHGDMVDCFPEEHRPYAVVFCTFNTFFNLPSHAAQRACLANAAKALSPGGAIVLEFAVFSDADSSDEAATEVVETRSRPDGSVVTSVSSIDRTNHTASGTFTDETGRSRAWSIAWATPSEIDAMAHDVGLVCTDRWEDFARSPIREGSVRQVCVLRRRLRSA